MKKTLFGLMALLVAVGFGFFVSCTKTDDAVMKKTTSNTKKDMVQKSQETIVIAVIESPKDLPEPKLTFSIEMVEAEVNKRLSEYYGSDYIFNDIAINDDAPLCSESIPFLELSITDLNYGETLTGFIPIIKNMEEGDASIMYYARSDERVRIKCKGKNCSGCTLNAERSGCTPCTNSDGKCTSKVSYSSGPSLLEAFERIADKIIEIIKSIM